MQDYKKTIVSQYGNSSKLLQLIDDFNDVVDPTVDIDAFYSRFWDIDTAVGVGLDIWGRIIGIGRAIHVTSVGKYLGFDEGQTTANDYQPFGGGVFYDGQPSGTYILIDSTFRTLLKARALGNITDGSIISYNKLLSFLFPANTVYLKNTSSRTIQIYFVNSPTQFEVSVLVSVFPSISPSGVQFTT